MNPYPKMNNLPVQMKPNIVLKFVPQIDHEATGKAVREYREKVKVTQLCVAQKLGKNYQTQVSFLEAGKRNWTHDRLMAVIAAIDSCAKISGT